MLRRKDNQPTNHDLGEAAVLMRKTSLGDRSRQKKLSFYIYIMNMLWKCSLNDDCGKVGFMVMKMMK